jgi:hypothetical protein
MTPLETLGVALLTGVAAAVVAAITTLLVEGRKHGYEDRIRFIDLRRQRYSELLREADEHIRILRRQLGVVEDWLMASPTKNDSPPPLPSTDPISHLSAEIGLLGRKLDVGDAARAVYEALVVLDRYAWDSDIKDVGAWLHNIDKPFRTAAAAYDEARARFVTAAREDLGRR